MEKGQYMAAIRASELHGRSSGYVCRTRCRAEQDLVIQLKDNMEVASYGLLDVLRKICRGGG